MMQEQDEHFSFGQIAKATAVILCFLVLLGLVGRNEYKTEKFFRLPYETRQSLMQKYHHKGAAQLYTIYSESQNN